MKLTIKSINKNTKVFEVVTKFPQALAFFVQNGFIDLKNPLMRNTIAKFVSIEFACKRHALDEKKFITELKKHLQTNQLKNKKRLIV